MRLWNHSRRTLQALYRKGWGNLPQKSGPYITKKRTKRPKKIAFLPDYPLKKVLRSYGYVSGSFDGACAIDGEKSWFNKDAKLPYAPDGYKWTTGARKKDITWAVMKRLKIQEYTKSFRTLEACFKSRQAQGFPDAQITKKASKAGSRICVGTEKRWSNI